MQHCLLMRKISAATVPSARCTQLAPGRRLPCMRSSRQLSARTRASVAGRFRGITAAARSFITTRITKMTFGVWCIAGPPIELVFPRAAVRSPPVWDLVVFDPFEIHGVLAPGCSTYAATDYQGADASVFLGFELGITPTVADAFDIHSDLSGQVISSRTRISAASGTIEPFD